MQVVKVLGQLGDHLCVGLGLELVALLDQEKLHVLVVGDDSCGRDEGINEVKGEEENEDGAEEEMEEGVKMGCGDNRVKGEEEMKKGRRRGWRKKSEKTEKEMEEEVRLGCGDNRCERRGKN